MTFKKFLYIFPALLIFIAPPVFAGEPPQLSSPSDGTTTSSSKLEWQTPSYPLYSGGSPYMVQVDDEQTFTNPEKNNIYLTNNYYTPQLNPGTWHWRVKAKDVDGVWSEWSSVWLFTLTSNSPNPSPSPTPDPLSDPAPTPVPTLTPQSTPQPTSSSQNSAFLISEVPSQINSDQSFSVSVNLILPNNPNTKFYLKGAFKKEGSSNYFGKTLVSDSWIKNGSSYSSQFPLTTDSSGNWSGNLEIMPDSKDSGFTGSGDYIFKVGRYTSSGSGPTWSIEVTIKITAVEVETSNEGGAGGSKSSSSSTPKPTSTSTNSTKKLSSNTSSIIKLPKSSQGFESSVAGIQNAPTPRASPETEVLEKREINFIPLLGGGFILAGLSSLGLIYLKNKGIYEKFFKQIR